MLYPFPFYVTLLPRYAYSQALVKLCLCYRLAGLELHSKWPLFDDGMALLHHCPHRFGSLTHPVLDYITIVHVSAV